CATMSQSVLTAPEPRVVISETARPPAARFYVPALDGLRFLAFAIVWWSHGIEYGGLMESVPPLGAFLKRLREIGWIGVEIFLCLSGFLIATLLLREIEAKGSLRIRDFYLRRVLRIWPLYYLMIVLGFVIMPRIYHVIATGVREIDSPEYTVMVNQ